MKGQVRRSQLITTYGVGAIIAIEDESFMISGIDRWPVRAANLHEPRLERALGVDGFVIPPASKDGQDIPVIRFPRWMWCPSCKRLDDHGFFTASANNECRLCGVRLVPSRFVVCCAKGHITDFPYFRWVHAGRSDRANSHELRIEMGGKTASLRDIRISCSCGAEKTMEKAFLKDAMKGILRCGGWRPWLVGNQEDCDQIPRTLQRGASNVWFSITHSAISIPPWSEGIHKIINRWWRALQSVPDNGLEETVRGMKLAEETPYTVRDLVEAIKQRKIQATKEGQPLMGLIKEQEYEALCRGREETSKDQDFIAVRPREVTLFTQDWFEQIMLVKRLREVRALSSFSRVSPPGSSDVFARPPIYDANPGWLPAVEVQGEGVFLRPKEGRLRSWESRAEIKRRAGQLDGNYRKRFELRNQLPDRIITPRLILLHSMAHALISQWALDAGYPAASLRERLYVSDSMAGILIYTATSDSAGSLGGIIAQAETDRLDASLQQAVLASTWCSADPLCIEAESAGVDSLNLAACHACMLLPEVSCEEMNLLLDRASLVGLPGLPDMGFFGELVART